MAPLLKNKNPALPSVFLPAALLREARRQKGLPAVDVPSVVSRRIPERVHVKMRSSPLFQSLVWHMFTCSSLGKKLHLLCGCGTEPLVERYPQTFVVGGTA